MKTVILSKSDFREPTDECDLWQELLQELDLPEDTDLVEVQLAD